MKQIGNFKVINHKPKSTISYPLIRLPQNYAYLAGEMAHVYLIETNDKPAFVISFDEHFDVDQFVQLKSKFSLCLLYTSRCV